MAKHKTAHQSAVKLLDRMKLASARSMAERYADDSDGDVKKHWQEVSNLLHQTHPFEVAKIYEQAEKDAAVMPQKQSKQNPTPTSTQPAKVSPAQNGMCLAGKHQQQPGSQKCDLCVKDDELEKVTDICKTFDRKLTQANNVLARHGEEMKTNPLQTMAWADSVFKATARMTVLTHVIQALTDDDGRPIVTKSRSDTTKGLQVWDTVNWVREYAQKEVNRRANSPSRSTSVCSNLMDSEILSAWAEVLETLLWS